MRIISVVAFALVYGFVLFVVAALIAVLYYAARDFGTFGLVAWGAFTVATSLFMARPLLRIWFPNALTILDDRFGLDAVEALAKLALALTLFGAATLPLIAFGVTISIVAFLAVGLTLLLCLIVLLAEVVEEVMHL